MRCYFHLVHDHDELIDDEGVEVSDFENAKAQAMMAVAELQREASCLDARPPWRQRRP
jgi:hypothetical protein